MRISRKTKVMAWSQKSTPYFIQHFVICNFSGTSSEPQNTTFYRNTVEEKWSRFSEVSSSGRCIKQLSSFKKIGSVIWFDVDEGAWLWICSLLLQQFTGRTAKPSGKTQEAERHWVHDYLIMIMSWLSSLRSDRASQF